MLLYKDEAFEDRWTTVPSLTLDDDIFVKVFMVGNLIVTSLTAVCKVNAYTWIRPMIVSDSIDSYS